MDKENDKGERIPDDRHHALDAIITAATTESQLWRLTRAIQKEEAIGGTRDFRDYGPPWEGFREQTIEAAGNVFVSRAERRRARGQAHAATIRSVSERGGETLVYQRVSVADLNLKDIERMKDPDRNAALMGSLRNWIEAGKPLDQKPKSPNGDDISKVRLQVRNKADVMIRGGAVDRGEMARVDVFRKKTPKGIWQYFLVPIYPHHIAKLPTPPTKAVQANTPEIEWPEMDNSYEFMWSLNPMNYLEIETNKGDSIAGYNRGLDRATGAVIVSKHHNSSELVKGIGARTLKVLNKYFTDRLGKLILIEKETRTWRGKACT